MTHLTRREVRLPSDPPALRHARYRRADLAVGSLRDVTGHDSFAPVVRGRLSESTRTPGRCSCRRSNQSPFIHQLGTFITSVMLLKVIVVATPERANR